jgi:hypothetical protein
MPAFVPFMLAGLFAIMAGSAVLKAAGLDGSQSQKASGNTVVRADSFRPATSSVPQRSNQPRSTGPAPSNTVVSGGSTAAPTAPTTPAPSTPPPPPPTVKAVPLAMEFPPPPTYEAVKAAPIDTVLFVDESFSQEFITDLLFEDVAGQELLSIARDDTVNGQSVIYQPIKNLGILRDTYDVNNLLKLQETSDRFFANFIINLFEKIPRVGNGPDGKNYYFDEVTGDGIIEFINMRPDEQVEIQISNAGIIEELGI